MGFLQIQFINVLAIFVIIASSKSSLSATPPNFPIAKPNCVDRCGNLSIPYPFGTTPDCFLNYRFFVACNETLYPPKLLFMQDTSIEVLDISLDGQLRTLQFIGHDCYDWRGRSVYHSDPSIKLPESFTVNSTANKFTMIGCDTYGYISGRRLNQEYFTGCAAECYAEAKPIEGSCMGSGCCQTSIPQLDWGIKFTLKSYYNFTQFAQGMSSDDNCGYAFLIEESAFTFSPENLTNLRNVEKLPMVINWAIGNGTCEESKRNVTSYACKSANSWCYEPENDYGYRCSCMDGYKGNPYLLDGCQDVNECEDPRLSNCEKLCVNTVGSFYCACPEGYYGDGRKYGRGCIRGGSLAFKLGAAVIVVMGLITLLSISFGLRKFMKKRKHEKRRQKFFKQNGGLLLQQQIAVQEGHTILGNIRIFTAKDLEKATDRFNESRILGQGGQGTVYKGMLSDGQIVAIKKSQLVNESKSDHLVEQFINEVVILSQINHKNVVKLLGCCLETKVPLLVYEFVPNGTLFDHIHDGNNGNEFPFSWNIRLKIAADVAGAFAHLHSATSLPIFHRDIKSSNILLDEKYVPKVSDFGTSKSLAVDQTHLTTLVNGTFGYIDPEYFRSSQFTEKSDVYSFGVVLVELLTGLRPILPMSTEEDEKSLVMRFLSSMNEDNLGSILDNQVATEGESEGVLAVAKLARRCLNLNGKKRPNMKEVAMELENVRMARMASNVQTRLQEDSKIFSEDNYDYNWTCPIDIGTTSLCDVHPLMFDTI